MTKLRVGDRVRVYAASPPYTQVGTIREIDKNGLLRFRFSGAVIDVWMHPKQCRRLKKKEQTVTVTRKQILDAWVSYVEPCHITDSFYGFIKELGFEEGE